MLTLRARLGQTLEQALADLPTAVPLASARRHMAAMGVRFRRQQQRLQPGQWVASACRSYHPDEMDAATSNRERARLRYRVTQMGMSVDQALQTPAMTPAEKGRLGALKRWGKPIVVTEGRQLAWHWL